MKSWFARVQIELLSSRWIEKILIALLEKTFRAQFELAWENAQEAPHFYSQHWNAFRLLHGTCNGPGWMLRGVYASEVIQAGARVLDIGCGDGFFSKTFLAPNASHVDGVDIEKSAVDEARTRHMAGNIRYALLDATKDAFPGDAYDVVVWDGAIGHFTPDGAKNVIRKIVRSLRDEGIFCGSESLGEEGHDHLQFFETERDVAELMMKSFAYVQTRVHSYSLPSGFLRREIYWRCSNSRERLASADWSNIGANPT